MEHTAVEIAVERYGIDPETFDREELTKLARSDGEMITVAFTAALEDDGILAAREAQKRAIVRFNVKQVVLTSALAELEDERRGTLPTPRPRAASR